MKTTLTILGIGNIKAGVGKDGRPYAFVNCAFGYESKFMQGMDVIRSLVFDSNIKLENLQVGGTVEAVIGFKDYAPYIVCFL